MLDAAPLDVVRPLIADCWLGPPRQAPIEPGLPGGSQIGAVTLRPHQSDAVRQLTDILIEHGGAILADAVGTGKTYTALALARASRRVLVVCPAGLRELWQRAAAETLVSVSTLSMEMMSRAAPTASAPDFVIVDEAHHFRNTHTRRYRALARLTAAARVLLLTATPVHNRVGDLAALLSLFLGARAWALSDDERSRYIVRRDHDLVRAVTRATAHGMSHVADVTASHLPALPQVIGPHVMTVGDDRATLQRIVSLPPPVPPRDGETCAALTAMGLIRQWASSAGALRAALQRRLERAVALESALEQGNYPSYRDLRDWCLGDGAIQLALPEILFCPTLVDPSHDRPRVDEAGVTMLLMALRDHASAVRELLRAVTAAPDLDAVRAERLRTISQAHPGSQLVAFSAFEETVRALYRQLRADGGVCALSAGGGIVASGRLSRADIIRQFAPGTRCPRRAERIRLLLTTDLLSEGVNLNAAVGVVHLDLPWTPARLEQRIGRVARLGSPYAAVHVYAFAPPASTEVLLQTEQRLRAKLDAAGRAVGIAGSIVPAVAVAASPDAHGPPERLAAARAIVSAWRRVDGDTPDRAVPGSWSCTAGPTGGFLAACLAGDRPLLIASLGDGVSDAPAALAEAVRYADGERADGGATQCGEAMQAIRSWWSERCAAADVGLASIGGVVSRRRVLRRIAAIARRTPLHARPAILALAERARQAATSPLGAAAEWVLERLASAPLADAQWLRAVAAFGDAYVARRPARDRPLARDIEVRALIVFSGRERLEVRD